jgi:NADPH-dependent curcumin reductase CurA
LTDIGQLKAGETLVVSGAAGATGSTVCRLGKILGARVIAIAGTDDKCKWLEDELGVDKALNYKSPTFVADFKESVGYLDVYFDNGRRLPFLLVCTNDKFRLVGGEILELCLTRLKKYARIVVCGMSYFSIVKTCADNHHRGDFRL